MKAPAATRPDAPAAFKKLQKWAAPYPESGLVRVRITKDGSVTVGDNVVPLRAGDILTTDASIAHSMRHNITDALKDD